MEQQTSVGGFLLRTLKGVAIALAISLLAAMVFAVILRFTTLPDRAVYPVNQTLKAVALCVGVLLSVRGERGFLQGIVIGVLYTVLSYVLFSALCGDFSLSFWILVEGLSAVLLGAVSGALAVNLREK